MTSQLQLGAGAVVSFVLFAALGRLVSNRPLTRLDAEAVYFRAQLTPLALAFTVSGRGPAMTGACIISIIAFAALRLPIVIPIVMTLAQVLSQTIVEYLKTRFKRIRPDYWLVGLEAGHSYPSGHATTAVVFFIGWAVIVGLSTLAPGLKTALIAIFTLWALGIAWSRLALGAHYLSDVFGGVLFGAAWLCTIFTISAHFYGILRLQG